MANGTTVTAGSGTTIATDELTFDGTPMHVQFVKLMDGTEGSVSRGVIDTSGALLVNVQGLRASGRNGAVGVGTTATILRVGGTNLVGRKSLHVQNRSAAAIFVGFAGVTTANGTEIPSGQSSSFDFGELEVYAIAASGTGNDVRIIEVA